MGRGCGQPNGFGLGGGDGRRQWVALADTCVCGLPGTICAAPSALERASTSAKPTRSSPAPPPTTPAGHPYTATRGRGADATFGKRGPMLPCCDLHGALPCA